MNIHLTNFFDDILKNNGYCDGIRAFAEGKDWNKDILSPIVNDYDDFGDAFNPHRFIDAVEDYINREEFDASKYKTLYDVLKDMWKDDFFENY